MEEEITHLYDQQEYSKILEKLSSVKYKLYNQFKYQGSLFYVEGAIVIQVGATAFDIAIVKITRIFQIIEPKSQKTIPLIEGLKYFRKQDIPMKFDLYFDSISEHEVMLSEYRVYFTYDQIADSAHVFSMEEFDRLEKPEKYHYFQRAKINSLIGIIDPPPSQWQKICECKVPYNPDLAYIQCDTCQTWYHISCMKLTKKEAELRSTWNCKKCERNGNHF